MAVGGYKCVSFSWTGGRTDTELDRCKYALHGFCSAIVNANLGWGWDTDFNDGTIGDYKTMGGHSSSKPNIAYILKLTYNNNVYRWCVGMNFSAVTALREQDCVKYWYNSTSTSYYNFAGGLYSGVIKNGTFTYDNTYGYIPDGTGQFLKWMHFAPWGNTSSPSDSYASFVRQNNSSYTYSYYALIKNAQVVVLYKSTQWNTSAASTAKLKGYMFGELFRETAHASDLNTFASIYLCSFLGHNGTTQYGCECGNTNTGSATETAEQTGGNSILINAKGTKVQFFKLDPSGTPYNSTNSTCSQIFTSSGTNLGGFDYVATNFVVLKYDTYPVNNTVSSVQSNVGGGRWTPCYVYYYTGDQQTYGVVQGDAFKGYLDTDLIRGVNPNYTHGQTLGDNGEFLYLGGGFAIGWDASNTVSMF